MDTTKRRRIDSIESPLSSSLKDGSKAFATLRSLTTQHSSASAPNRQSSKKIASVHHSTHRPNQTDRSAYTRTPRFRAVTASTPEYGLSPEEVADIDDRENADSMNEIIMAIDVTGQGNVGCSYYIAREERLLLLSDVPSGGLEVVDVCR